MGAAVAAAAASAARARREALEHFRVAGATRPETAVPLPDVRPAGRRQLARWERRGVVRPATGGGYWLDEVAYAADEAARRRRVLVALVLAFALLAVGVWLSARTAQPV